MNKASDLVGILLATALGSGFAPFAPGTAGSLLAGVIFLLTPGGHLLLLLPILPGAWWGCRWGWRRWGKDPSRVTIDEFAGCWVACLAAPSSWGPYGIVAAFLLFRILDIVKPWPVSLLDRLDSPLGILGDDLASGVLAAGVLALAGSLLPW